MLTVRVKDTHLLVSRACLGTMTFGAQTPEGEAVRMVDCCLDRGINFIDTANAYNNGAAESIVGKALAGRRGRVVLASKVGLASPEGKGLSREAILKAAEGSLRRLGTDYLDVYYLHEPDRAVPLEESLEAMECLVRAGKVRYAAASNYAAWEVCRMVALAGRSGAAPVRFVQPPYSLLARRAEQELFPMCRAFGLATVAYNPLAGGMMTGKHRMEGPAPGTRFDLKRNYKDRYWNESTFRAVETLGEQARAEGRSLVSLALNWILHHSAADCVSLGASRFEQLEENLAALEDGPLAAGTLEVCERVWADLRGAAPAYHR